MTQMMARNNQAEAGIRAQTLMTNLRAAFQSGNLTELRSLLHQARDPHALDGLNMMDHAFAEDFIGEASKYLAFDGRA